MRVLVAMSGGVDSSVTAALLHEAGHEVIGVTCLFSTDPPIPRVEALSLAKEVAVQLGIEHHSIDVQDGFEQDVVIPFAQAYARGQTPNPCVMCNPTMKFKTLFEAADDFGCEAVATGHYTLCGEVAGKRVLRRGDDTSKDQSYFLYRLGQEALERLIFPLAGLTKAEVRDIARRHGLASAESPESQDICFVGDGGYIPLVKRYASEAFTPGSIVDESGEVLGEHDGIGRYTIGQRKGIGIARPEPLYVVGIDAGRNEVVVGPSKALLVHTITAHDVVAYEPVGSERLCVKIRHGMEPVRARVTLESDTLTCELDEPVSGVASGQSVVCYRDDIVICGGIIS